MATLPEGNQEPLVVKDKVDDLGVSKSLEYDNLIDTINY